MNQYHFKYDKASQQITDVRHWELGSVAFKLQLIDEMSTLILNSKIQIYTSLLEKDFGNDRAEILNVIHVHLNDKGESATLDVVYLNRGETRENHMEFKTDEMGLVLRYRILVKDLAIHEVLYNTGSSIESIPFEEFKLQPSEKRIINNVDDISQGPVLA